MGPDLTLPGARTACPSCAARVRPDATFCGQCYADFRPPPPAPAVPATPPATAAYGTPAPDPLTAPLLDVVLPAQAAPSPAQAEKTTGWPCTRCSHLNPFRETVCAVCSAPFLATVAEEGKVSLTLPVVGDLSRYGRGQRAGIALAAILVVLLPLALITLLLTKAPPSNPAPSPTSGTTVTEVTPAG